MKTTDQLMNELMKSNNISEYLKQNSKFMLTEEFSVYLTNILNKKHVVKSSVIKTSELSEVMGYQIFSGTRNPSRDSLLCILIAMELDIEQTQEILKIAEFAPLFPKLKRDAIIISGIVNRNSVAEINETLYDNNEHTLNK